jgi:hypothetical protein
VAATRVNRDPAAATAFAVAKKIVRGQRSIECAGIMERERDCARTVVASIAKRCVVAASDIRSVAN